jgi:hypothetical protein
MTRTSRKVEAAAIDSLKDAYGNLERRYATDVLLVPPSVTLDGDKLLWRLRPKEDIRKARDWALRRYSSADAARFCWNAHRILPGADMLRAFVNLVDAPPKRVLTFARHWGPLGVCSHGLPSSHELNCAPCGWDGHGGWELLERWDYYTRRAQAVLFLASRLRKCNTGPVAQLKPLLNDLSGLLLGAGRLHTKEICPPDWWMLVLRVVNEWIEHGGVRPRLHMSRDTSENLPRLVLTPTYRSQVPEFSLFGALGMQLALAVSGERGLAFCSSCGTCFEPGQQLRKDVRHYCSDCADRGKWRNAAAAYRARKKKSARGARP